MKEKSSVFNQMKVRIAERTFDMLNDYLPRELVIELELSFAMRPSIVICKTICNIIEQYKSSDENKKRVQHLLERVLKIHFFPDDDVFGTDRQTLD